MASIPSHSDQNTAAQNVVLLLFQKSPHCKQNALSKQHGRRECDDESCKCETEQTAAPEQEQFGQKGGIKETVRINEIGIADRKVAKEKYKV